MLKLTNTQPGPRGFNSVSGPVLVEPGESAEAKVYEREKEHLEAAGWFKITGSYEGNPKPDAAEPKKG